MVWRLIKRRHAALPGGGAFVRFNITCPLTLNLTFPLTHNLTLPLTL